VRKSFTVLAAAGLAFALGACGLPEGDTKSETTGVHANVGAKVGIAMPTRVSERWRNDANNMVEQFIAMGYKTDLQFGDDNIKNQIAQIQAMIDDGDKLLVIGAIDGSSLTKVLANAAKAKIPVISYDRLLRESPNVSYYVTFDNFRVGVLQGSLLADRLGLADGKGPFTMEVFAGSPDDSNAIIYYDGAMQVLKPYLDSGQLVVKSKTTAFKAVSTLRWDVPTAQLRMTKVLGRHYSDTNLDAILSPFDGMSVGIIKVLKANGYGTKGKPLPVISGQDAEIPAMKAIIAGEQSGTIFKDTRELAKVAVQMGNALLTGAVPLTNDSSTYDNGVKVIPTYLLQPIAVDKTNYKTLLVDGGYYEKGDLGK
jgi:putative multiple sugar transport system substrate-binding protein